MDKLKDMTVKLWQTVTLNHFKIYFEGQEKISLPLIVPIILAVFCGELILAAVIAVLFGVTYKIEREDTDNMTADKQNIF